MLHPCYWPEVRRGSERVIHDLGARLAARGHHPRLITSHPGPRSQSVEDGIEILRLHRPRGRRLQLGMRDVYLTHVRGSMRALRETQPDLVHAFYPVDGLAASRWARRSGRPLVFSLMGTPRPEALRRPVWRRIVAEALRRADATVCLSQHVAALADEAFGVRPRVIHPGIDLEVFRPSAPRAAVPTILCPADLSDPRKGGALLHESFRLIRSRHPEARLVLDRRRAANPLPPDEDGVEYRDLDTSEALVRAYSEAWLTVLLSRAEAFGLVLGESLACGTPVVATPGGGVEEMIDGDGVGRVVDSDAPEPVADAIDASMGAGEEIRAACIARADRFSADRAADAYEALYGELV